MLAQRTDPPIANADGSFLTAIVAERLRLMDFYNAGLNAYAGEREQWARNMGKVSAAGGPNLYYAWFKAGTSESRR